MAFFYLITISYILINHIQCDAIPVNGTFIFTQYSDSECKIVSSANGFTSKSKYWNQPFSNGTIFKPNSFNEENVLEVVTCDIEGNDDLIKEPKCSGEKKTFKCDGSCIKNEKYSCNFVETSSLAVFTFTVFSDGGCNNVNGEKYPLKLSTYCWKLHGEGSMSIVDFVKRDLVVNVFESSDCTGAIITENKKVKCNEKCIDNPINEDDVHYSCKYTNSVFIKNSFIRALILVLLYMVI